MLTAWLDSGPLLQDVSGTTLLLFDVAVTELHERAVKVMQHPTEVDFEPTDHVRPQAARLEMSVVMSDTAPNGAVEAGRAQVRWRKLVEIMYAGTPVAVVTGLETYPQMLIESMSTTRDANSGCALVCDVVFLEFRTVDVAYVNIPARLLRKPDKGGCKVDEGKGEVEDLPLSDNCAAIDELTKGMSARASGLLKWCYYCGGTPTKDFRDCGSGPRFDAQDNS